MHSIDCREGTYIERVVVVFRVLYRKPLGRPDGNCARTAMACGGGGGGQCGGAAVGQQAELLQLAEHVKDVVVRWES